MKILCAIFIALFIATSALADSPQYGSANNPAIPVALQGQPIDGPMCYPKNPNVAIEIQEMQIALASHEIWLNAEETSQTNDPAAGGIEWNAAWNGVYENVIVTLCRLSHSPIVTNGGT
jgi:hypothetical protein